ncbi:MAG TPA: hypothetical protein VFU02_13700, partial [Polyangiaceae bacterium]|nr:hypothetical protein [Polyangiaceae bacterium]
MRLFSITVLGALLCSSGCSSDPEGDSDAGSGGSGVNYADATGGIDLDPSANAGDSGSGGGPMVGVSGGSSACGSLEVTDGC